MNVLFYFILACINIPGMIYENKFSYYACGFNCGMGVYALLGLIC